MDLKEFEIFPVTCELSIQSLKIQKNTRFIISIYFEGFNGYYLSFETSKDFKSRLSTIFNYLKKTGPDNFCTNKLNLDYLKKLDCLYKRTEELGFDKDTIDLEETIELWAHCYERKYSFKANNSQEILDFYNNVTTL